MFSKKYLPFNLFYLFIIVVNILFMDWLTDYRVVAKPMIMASLIGFYISTVRNQSPLFILALIAALFGDIFLMFESEDFFLLGLGSFMVMQILYTLTFLPDRNTNIKENLPKIIGVLVTAIVVLSFLWSTLGEMLVPVAIYTAAICMMVTSALIRKNTLTWYLPVVFGVILFLISDALIAFNKFGGSFAAAPYLIILTYMIAQYLIVRGVIERSTYPTH
ncbi:MAG: lysoplasmalogenase [Saprospiraceae bacterium]